MIEIVIVFVAGIVVGALVAPVRKLVVALYAKLFSKASTTTTTTTASTASTDTTTSA